MVKKKDRVRLTISIEPDVLETFRKLADAMAISVGRAIGDWCGDTQEGAQHVTGQMMRARAQPNEVLKRMRQHAAIAGAAMHESDKRTFGVVRRKPS